MTESKKELGVERKSIVNFEWRDDDKKTVNKLYTVEKRGNGEIYFDEKLVVIKPLDKLRKEERKIYDLTRKDGFGEDHALLKASLTFFFHDEKCELDHKKFPHLQGNGSMYEITDAFILRAWLGKHLHGNYTVSKYLWRVSSPSGKFMSLPSTCSDFVDTDFNKILDLLE